MERIKEPFWTLWWTLTHRGLGDGQKMQGCWDHRDVHSSPPPPPPPKTKAWGRYAQDCWGRGEEERLLLPVDSEASFIAFKRDLLTGQCAYDEHHLPLGASVQVWWQPRRGMPLTELGHPDRKPSTQKSFKSKGKHDPTVMQSSVPSITLAPLDHFPHTFSLCFSSVQEPFLNLPRLFHIQNTSL